MVCMTCRKPIPDGYGVTAGKAVFCSTCSRIPEMRRPKALYQREGSAAYRAIMARRENEDESLFGNRLRDGFSMMGGDA